MAGTIAGLSRMATFVRRSNIGCPFDTYVSDELCHNLDSRFLAHTGASLASVMETQDRDGLGSLGVGAAAVGTHRSEI